MEGRGLILVGETFTGCFHINNLKLSHFPLNIILWNEMYQLITSSNASNMSILGW